MKKTALLLTVLLLLCGCSEAKQEDDSSQELTMTAETNDTEDISDTEEMTDTSDTGGTLFENGFREFDQDEFSTIKVSLTYPDKEPPVGVESVRLPEYDFGERLAPCKNSDELWRYYGGQPQSEKTSDPENIMYQPEKGRVKKAYKRDNKIYMIVSYDNMCYCCHEWSVFCYDILTKKTDEIYTNPSDLDRDCNELRNTFIIGNKLVNPYFTNGDDDSAAMHIELIDLESGTSEEIYNKKSNMTSIFSNGSDKLVFCEQIFSEYTSNKLTLTEYNIETGETRDIIETDVENITNICVSDIAGYILHDEKENKWNLVTEHYRINTDIIGTEAIYLSDKKAVLNETSLHKIHTFDFEKMEHYVTSYSNDMGRVYSFDGNLIMCQNDKSSNSVNFGAMYVESGDYYYIIPELGVSYKLAEENAAGRLERCGDGMEFCCVEPDEIHLDSEQTTSTAKIISANVITKREG